ncbi:MAG: hypothetical protein IPP78_00840 [Holophagaceae bacterium]|nr:hypothetical protein [Holophagaceae bacterium]
MQFGPDQEHAPIAAALDKQVGQFQSVEESAALLPDIEGRDVPEPESRLEQGPFPGRRWSGVIVAKITASMSVGSRPALAMAAEAAMDPSSAEPWPGAA